MNRGRRIGALVALVAVAALIPVPIGPAGAGPGGFVPACDDVITQECVVSVERNGVLRTYPGASDGYDVNVFDISGTTIYSYYFYAQNDSQPYNTLDTTDVWKIVINTGSSYPGETFARGKNVQITRGGNATDGYTVGFKMRPVRTAETGDACGGTGTCPETAPFLKTGYLDGWVDDLSYISDPDDRAAMRGFDLATNADYVSSPLQLDFATNAIFLDVANSHFEPDGTTVFVGRAEFRLPFAMLRRLYLVDDPASLTASAFQVTAGSGPAPITNVIVGDDDVRVVISDITFSKRRLKIKSDTTPRAPRNVEGERISHSRGKVLFDRALPRGSKVRGYLATCKHNDARRRASGDSSPITIEGLSSARWECSLRAKSKAGLGDKANFHIPRA